MFSSYIKLAIRNLQKNRLYAAINVFGLAIGLTVYLMGNILGSYENNHDSMFKNRDRTYTVGAQFSPDANIGVSGTDGVQSALGPVVKAEVEELDSVVRTVRREYLITQGNDSYYQGLRFADSELTSIFNFDYLHGDASVLEDPQSLLLTESTALKYFGRTDVLGETLTFDHKNSMYVGAVIKDLPADTHFNSFVLGDIKLGMIAPFAALETIEDYAFEGEWDNVSLGNLTYMLAPEGKDQVWLQDELDSIYERHYTKERKEFFSGLTVRPLVESNTVIWEVIGLPMIESIKILGLLVLIIACVNYTNLATAQSLGRTQEVGLRKTFGAERSQLLTQFLTESLTIATLAMLISIASLEVIVPLFNQATGKALSLDYLSILPWLTFTTVMVGVLAGAYPAYLITKASPIDSLKNSIFKSAGGNRFRNIMIGVQFAISIFMLAIVLVVYFQNKNVESSSNIFSKDQIVVIERVGVDEIAQRHDTLRQELLTLPGVNSVTYSNQVPFEQNNSHTDVTPVKGDNTVKVALNRISIDFDFLETYSIPLLAGRNFSRDIANDFDRDGPRQINVILNEMAVERLGFERGESAIGKSFYDTFVVGEDDNEDVQYTIVGLVPDQNFLGLHNKIKQILFFMNKDSHRIGSIKISPDQVNETLQSIDEVWNRVVPDYPIQRRFLDDVFGEIFFIFQQTTNVLAGFSAVALSLALIGLFGLAAFLAERRTKEIGIRKVLGARTDQIVWLLIWQFSIPVLWSLLAAIPLAYFASNIYLDFFSERINTVLPVLLLASVVGIATAWGIVAIHASKIARTAPIRSLRYE